MDKSLQEKYRRGETVTQLPADYKEPKKLVYVLIITHRFGSDTWVFSTQEKANDAIYAFVEKWWESEMVNIPMPAVKQEAINAYFAAMEGIETVSVEDLEIDAADMQI